MARSMRVPLLSLRSRNRHAAACARISSFGYHLNGTLTSSVWWPWSAELPDQLPHVVFGAALDERHLGFTDDDTHRIAVELTRSRHRNDTIPGVGAFGPSQGPANKTRNPLRLARLAEVSG